VVEALIWLFSLAFGLLPSVAVEWIAIVRFMLALVAVAAVVLIIAQLDKFPPESSCWQRL
jgi:hypothetical protein